MNHHFYISYENLTSEDINNVHIAIEYFCEEKIIKHEEPLGIFFDSTQRHASEYMNDSVIQENIQSSQVIQLSYDEVISSYQTKKKHHDHYAVIVSPAIRDGNDVVLCVSYKIEDPSIKLYMLLNDDEVDYSRFEQGFVDQFNRFHTPKEAYIIANRQKQIKNKDSFNLNELKPFHLYVTD